jgi:2'-phosphotransferase
MASDNSTSKKTKSENDTISRFLSYKLRHDPTVSRDEEGFVLLDKLGLENVSLDTIKEIVKTSNKSRFTLKEVDGQFYIRANQGHSKEIGDQLNDSKVLTKIAEPIDGIFHGTYIEHLESIEEKGLSRMARKHIHLAKSKDAKSGKRQDCTVIIYVDMKSAMADGIKFYESENGVILTEGINGILSTKYFSKIEHL